MLDSKKKEFRMFFFGTTRIPYPLVTFFFGFGRYSDNVFFTRKKNIEDEEEENTIQFPIMKHTIIGGKKWKIFHNSTDDDDDNVFCYFRFHFHFLLVYSVHGMCKVILVDFFSNVFVSFYISLVYRRHSKLSFDLILV